MQCLAWLTSVSGGVMFISILVLGLADVRSAELPGFLSSALQHAFALGLVVLVFTGGFALLLGRR